MSRHPQSHHPTCVQPTKSLHKQTQLNEGIAVPTRTGKATTRRAAAVLGNVLVIWAGGLLALLAAARTSAIHVSARGLTGLDGLVVAAACVGAAVVLSWLAAALVVSVVELAKADWHPLPSRVASTSTGAQPPSAALGLAGLPHVFVPRQVRRIAALVLGLSLAVGTAGAAPAATIPAMSSTPAPSAVVAEPTAAAMPGAVAPPLAVGHQAAVPPTDRPTQSSATWTPDRPAASVARALLPDIALVTAAPRLGAEINEDVAVRAGDTLWSIAVRHLGPDARSDEVARAWPVWWRANRAVIGEDPDLILPGQVLHVPSGPPE